MKKEGWIRLLNGIGFLMALYVNYLSVVTRWGGKTIRELSDQYANLFTPSNGTFAIWSLIYLLVTLFLILQFSAKYRSVRITRNLLFITSCCLNAAWIVCWQFEYIALSLLVMLGLLTTLAAINHQLRQDGNALFKLIFGVYLGWICIATIANVTTLLIACGMAVNVQVQVFITLMLLVVAALLVAWIMKKLANPFLSIAVCWAFYGIYVKRATDFPVIAHTALAMAVLVLFAIWFFSIRPSVNK